MADRSISELPTASTIGATDLFVLQQANAAKKLTGQALENWLLQLAQGHGGIQSISKTSSSGSNPVVDTYTITFADTTTSTFTVTNGFKGDTGAQTYVHIKYAARNPQTDSDLSDTPDKWIGMYVGLSATAPTTRTSYRWYQFKGEKGDTGDPASISSKSVQYQTSTSGTTIPTGTWQDNVPTVAGGHYLWTRVVVTYNTGDVVTSYSVGYKGTDGTGSGDMTKLAYDSLNEVAAAGGIPAFVGAAVSAVSQNIPSASSANPQMNGSVNPGSANNYSRADHVHPSDTSKLSTDLTNMPTGAIQTAMLANNAVTGAKIAAGAVSGRYAVTIPSAAASWERWDGGGDNAWYTEITVSGVRSSDRGDLFLQRGIASDAAPSLAGFEQDAENFAHIVAVNITADDTLRVFADEIPANDIYCFLRVVKK